MKFIIIGSGGCVSLPKPLCNCNVCNEAREKGRPYSRFGCSLFLEEAKLVVDTPEDIGHALNHAGIKEVEAVLFSHLDPDHTLGMRIFEHLRLNWFDVSIGKECINPIDVYAMEHVMSDINTIGFKYGCYLDYYEKVRNLIKRNVVKDLICLNGIKISFVKANDATVFVFEEGNKKLIFAPCDVKPFPEDDIFNDADVLLIGNTIPCDVLKNGFILDENSMLKKELFSMGEIKGLKEKYKIKKVIITHLEEDWGKSYDDYLKMEKQFDGIIFAYDGMILEV